MCEIESLYAHLDYFIKRRRSDMRTFTGLNQTFKPTESEIYLTNAQRDVKIQFKQVSHALLDILRAALVKHEYRIGTMNFSFGRLESWTKDRVITEVVCGKVKAEDYIAKPECKSFLISQDRFEFINELNLCSNNLSTFDCEPFGSLTNLTILNLSRNELRSIDKSQFQNLTKLQYLDLSLNRIEKLDADCFQHLVNLEILDLSYNKLKSIHTHAFIWCDYLEELNMSQNPLKTRVLTKNRRGLQRLRYLQKLNSFCSFNWREYRLRDEEVMLHKPRLESVFLIRNREGNLTDETVLDMTLKQFVDYLGSYQTSALLPFIKFCLKDTNASNIQTRIDYPHLNQHLQDCDPTVTYFAMIDDPRFKSHQDVYSCWRDFVCKLSKKCPKSVNFGGTHFSITAMNVYANLEIFF
jgi:hypothetical protein